MSSRIAGIDYGTKRIGIALASVEVGIASPHEVYERHDEVQDASYFTQLVATENINKFVVGLPVHLSGEESQQSHAARQFGAWLEEACGVPVEFFDERFTSSAADDVMATGELTKKNRKVHRGASDARIMLTAYLEAGHGDDNPGGID